MAEFILSSRNNHQLLLLDFYLFQKEKTSNQITYWRCIQFNVDECSGRARTKNGIPIFHNHKQPDIADIEARRELNRIKQVASSSQSLPNNIIADISSNISIAATGKMSSCSLIKRTIQRKRRQVGRAPAVPVSLIDLVIPIEYQLSNNNEQFLLYDSGHHDHRCIIFSTIKNLQFLSTCDKWYADGTFKTCPPLFQQIYTIHGMKHKTIIPAIYVLMASRRQQDYLNIFNQIKNFQIFLNPKVIIIDFELAALSAFKQSFPMTAMRGCLFHMSQCIWRTVQKNPRICNAYKSETNFAMYIKMLMSLAYVPVEDVIHGFEELCASIFYQENRAILAPLIEYFEETWIGKMIAMESRSPIFGISLWNCYESTLASEPNTNNSVEGWHRSFSSHISSHHPTIWKFIKTLKDEDSLNSYKLEQYSLGLLAPVSKKEYRERSKRILLIVEDFHSRTMMDYLRALSHNLNLNV
ncbi:uncharacterized protein LOC135929050 [Gordionus sp. m RMFG-2023]|uniref:uncharacterized protein LOC135929050 n=1 Tax=Gordionus sp. m RMFG-2023 TaxID=3053472 RepID=UPI0031FDF8C1